MRKRITNKLSMSVSSNDPRVCKPQCYSLQPVTIVHENRWFSILKRGDFFTLEYHQPQVVVLPVVDGSSIVMVKVKRPILADNPLELPAGGAKDGELPREAAAREFVEETGICVSDIKRFNDLPPLANSPNRNPNLVSIFQVHLSKIEFENRAGHDTEIEGVKLFSLDQIDSMLVAGEIYVAVPAAVLSRYLLERKSLDHAVRQ